MIGTVDMAALLRLGDDRVEEIVNDGSRGIVGAEPRQALERLEGLHSYTSFGWWK